MKKVPPKQQLNPPLMPSEAPDPMQGAKDAIKALHEQLDREQQSDLKYDPMASAMEAFANLDRDMEKKVH